MDNIKFDAVFHSSGGGRVYIKRAIEETIKTGPRQVGKTLRY